MIMKGRMWKKVALAGIAVFLIAFILKREFYSFDDIYEVFRKCRYG